MAKGSPSLVALLGLLAVAGYQNRDKLGELINSRSGNDADRNRFGASGQADSQGGLLDQFRQMAGGADSGGLMGGISELLERFSGPQQAKAQSWIGTGRNESIDTDELELALDEDTIAELVQKTGLSRSELMSRLSQTLPDAVDQATPNGQFPPLGLQEPRSF